VPELFPIALQLCAYAVRVYAFKARLPVSGSFDSSGSFSKGSSGGGSSGSGGSKGGASSATRTGFSRESSGVSSTAESDRIAQQREQWAQRDRLMTGDSASSSGSVSVAMTPPSSFKGPGQAAGNSTSSGGRSQGRSNHGAYEPSDEIDGDGDGPRGAYHQLQDQDDEL
jgi:hypothetical protein